MKGDVVGINLVRKLKKNQTRNHYIYIIELKIDQSADIALRQIEEKGYASPFATDPRKLFKIGVNFSTEKRRIDDWKIGE